MLRPYRVTVAKLIEWMLADTATEHVTERNYLVFLRAVGFASNLVASLMPPS